MLQHRKANTSTNYEHASELRSILKYQRFYGDS